MLPPNEQNDVKIITKAIVCEDSVLRGDITISPGCVIHPCATIIAEGGAIVLGENCIVEEYATIAFRTSASSTTPVLHIGANNVFEVGCIVEAHSIGNKNVFEAKCFVGPNVTVSSGCIIGAGCRLNTAQHLVENSVIYGAQECQQREALESHGTQTLQIDFLRKVLPNYHHLRKPNYDPKKARSGI